MKKFLIILLLPLFLGACTKDDYVQPKPDPGPDPNPISYKATILVTFNSPEGVHLYIGDNMWVLDSEKKQLTDRIDTFNAPTITIVLTGDTAKNNLNKKVYLYFYGTRIIGHIRHGYEIRKAFTLQKEVSLTFDVPSTLDNVEILDP